MPIAIGNLIGTNGCREKPCASLERFFAWGNYHAEDVRRATDLSDHRKILPGGSPRLDLLRPEFREFYRCEADKIRAKHGRIVLVNTNFHRFNHFLGRGAYLKGLKKGGKVPTAEREAFFQQWIDFLELMYRAFSRMLRAAQCRVTRTYHRCAAPSLRRPRCMERRNQGASQCKSASRGQFPAVDYGVRGGCTQQLCHRH